VVEAVGERVSDLAPGDEVLGTTGLARAGAFAQYVAAPAAQLVKKPAGLTFTDAAASVNTGLAALVAMRDVAQVGPGTRVLINGASGGVGTMAVQIAKALGAEVTGVCGTARNIELARSLGADHVIDYTREDFTQSRQRYDVVLDNVLNHPPKATARVLAPGGVLIPNSFGYTGGLLAGLPRLARAVLMGFGSTTVKLVSPAMNRENLDALVRFLESGQVKVVIDKTYPLGQAADAVTHVLEHHASGKIAITA
jgi:NADPH:quinone reductase-like Zn-dependent oxidoreductase